MTDVLQLGDISVEVLFKDIKNVHLSVHPPTGRVRISAPCSMNMETVRLFAISKLGWIKRHQRRQRAQERETPREYIERESHYLWGRRYLLRIVEGANRNGVELDHRHIEVRASGDANVEKRRAVLEAWYRQQLRHAATALIGTWQERLGVEVERFYVQRMKTKWGSCNPDARTIRLNTELAKKPPECVEYIVVHEMAHLIERHHNDRFIAILDRHLPHWKTYRDELNAAPLAHEDWTY